MFSSKKNNRNKCVYIHAISHNENKDGNEKHVT